LQKNSSFEHYAKMKIDIEYSKIIERSKMFSEYEARQASNGTDENLFLEVRLTDGEDLLLRTYIEQALQQLEGVLGGALEEDVDFGDSDAESASLTIGKGLAAAGGGNSTKSFIKSIEEAASAFCMYKWLLNKLPERSATYQNMFTDMSAVCKKIAWKRVRPNMDE